MPNSIMADEAIYSYEMQDWQDILQPYPEGITGITGPIATQRPYSCTIDLVNRYCNGGQVISESQKKAAYQAFTETTGFHPIDLTKITDNMANQGNNLANFNSFYMFMPMTVLLLIFIWLMVGFRRINWVLGLFATVFVIVILYSFSIAYRMNVKTYVQGRQNTLNQEIQQAQQNYQDSVAYWNQGLFASACAITCTGGTGCWSCPKKTSPTGATGLSPAPAPVPAPEVPGGNVPITVPARPCCNPPIHPPDLESRPDLESNPDFESRNDFEPPRRIRKRKLKSCSQK